MSARRKIMMQKCGLLVNDEAPSDTVDYILYGILLSLRWMHVSKKGCIAVLVLG